MLSMASIIISITRILSNTNTRFSAPKEARHPGHANHALMLLQVALMLLSKLYVLIYRTLKHKHSYLLSELGPPTIVGRLGVRTPLLRN